MMQLYNRTYPCLVRGPDDKQWAFGYFQYMSTTQKPVVCIGLDDSGFPIIDMFDRVVLEDGRQLG